MLIVFDKTKSECKADVIYLAVWAVRPIVQQEKDSRSDIQAESEGDSHKQILSTNCRIPTNT